LTILNCKKKIIFKYVKEGGKDLMDPRGWYQVEKDRRYPLTSPQYHCISQYDCYIDNNNYYNL
jgi:hypothetical protein